jgi:glycosyltransferase involved in cell wall biosynthesis
LVITHHADVYGRPILRRIVMPLYRRLTRQARCIVVNSLTNAQNSRDLRHDGGPVVEIPWGVDPNPYEISEFRRSEFAAERQNRFGSSPVIGFVGRFVRYKGLSILIDALKLLEGVHALLIGNGPLRSKIEEQVKSSNLADRVHFLGNIDEARKIRELAMMDLLVLPSIDTTEAFGLAQVEAQLMRLPVVASRLQTGVIDVTIDNITGLLVPPRDPAALAAAISCLIRDRALAERLGSAGRKYALKRFTLDAFQNSFAELFDAVLSKQSLEQFRARTLEHRIYDYR